MDLLEAINKSDFCFVCSSFLEGATISLFSGLKLIYEALLID